VPPTPGLQVFTRIDALFTTAELPFVFPFNVERKFKKSATRIQEEEVKSKIVKITLFGVLAIATLVAGIAFAQSAGAPMHHGMHEGGMGGPGFGFPMHMLHELNLTEDQHSQIKQIFQTEKPNLQPLMQQEMQAHQQLIQLVTSGNFDQAKATAIASQEAQTHIQMEVEHAKIGAQIYQLLSSDQKAKVGDMIAKHQQRMQEHMQKAAPPENQ
jgi:protein CpxP